jgi:flagellar hook-length control protein FliK
MAVPVQAPAQRAAFADEAAVEAAPNAPADDAESASTEPAPGSETPPVDLNAWLARAAPGAEKAAAAGTAVAPTTSNRSAPQAARTATLVAPAAANSVSAEEADSDTAASPLPFALPAAAPTKAPVLQPIAMAAPVKPEPARAQRAEAAGAVQAALPSVAPADTATLPPVPVNLAAAVATTPGTATPAAAPAPVQAQIDATPGTPAFPNELGARISVLVSEGAQHAELKLNPAELGPVGVRISLDGNNAQVDFSAANAATRQAIEQSVPALASALREGGLTLTGGGVFQQHRDAQGQAQPQAGPGAARGAVTDDGALPGRPAATAPARGLLDLFA